MQAHFNLGNYYRQTAKFEAAEFCYKAVVDAVPEHWRGLLNLAVAQVGLKKTSEAQKNLRRAFKASGLPSPPSRSILDMSASCLKAGAQGSALQNAKLD